MKDLQDKKYLMQMFVEELKKAQTQGSFLH